MIMPFGKYKGDEIDSIPSDYLKWAAENIDDEEICCAADDEYQWRTDNNEHFYEWETRKRYCFE